KFTFKRKYNRVAGPFYNRSPEFVEGEKRLMDVLGSRYEEVVFGNTFFKNLGNSKFQEMSDRAGLETFWPWGIVTGDFDNDGYEDVYLPSGMGHPYGYWPSSLTMH